MLRLLALLTTLISLATAERSFAEFEIRKRHTTGDKSILVGKLSLNIDLPYNTVEAYVDSHIGELVSSEDFQTEQQVILEFVCIDTDLPEYKDKFYMTSVDEISNDPHGQKIAIILGPHTQGVSINTINYIHTRERVGDIYAEVVPTHQKMEDIFKYQYAPKKSEVENQSFWGKYKWYLIIGGVVVFTMMNAGGDAKQPAGGASR